MGARVQVDCWSSVSGRVQRGREEDVQVFVLLSFVILYFLQFPSFRKTRTNRGHPRKSSTLRVCGLLYYRSSCSCRLE